jgi:hypothetical protein
MRLTMESNWWKRLGRGETEVYKGVTTSVMSGGRTMVALEEKAAPLVDKPAASA